MVDHERVSRRTALTAGLVGAGALAGAGALVGCAGPVAPTVAPADLDVLNVAAELVRLDTSHNGEGGRTMPYAKLLARKFSAAGAEVKIIPTPKPENAHFIARIRGTGANKPLLFLGHSDVVSVERERWSVDPYGAEVRDGWIYGRGTLDMKGANAAALTALLRLLGEGARFDRDIIYLADCDEEAGPSGTRWLAERHWPLIDAGAVITEGGWILTRADGVTPMLAAVTVQDKSATNLELVARGTATHSSKPTPDSAILRLDRAVTQLSGYQPPVALTPLNRAYFEGLAGASDDPALTAALRELLAAPDQAAADRAGERVVALSRYPWLHNALLRHTVTQVIQQAGYRSNVSPGSGTALMNLRLLPGGHPVGATIDAMRATLGGDPQLTLGISARGGGPATGTPEEQLAQLERRLADPPSSTDTDVYRALAAALGATFGGVPVVPGPFEAGTSGSPWRQRGIPVYGVYPYPVDNDTIVRMHGTDERIRVDALRAAADVMYRLFGSFRV